MIISRVMTKNPIFIRPNMSLSEVNEFMKKEHVSKLPVLDKNDKLVGLVTKKELRNAGPSDATTLDMYEISYLLSKLHVDKIMVKNVLTVEETAVVEEAARIMADNDIGCLPVMRGSVLVGIITERDLFHVFIDMFGARYKGVRVTMLLNEKPGQLAKLTQAIAENGANIVSIVTCEADDCTKRRCTCKVDTNNQEMVEKAVKDVGGEIEDIRLV